MKHLITLFVAVLIALPVSAGQWQSQSQSQNQGNHYDPTGKHRKEIRKNRHHHNIWRSNRHHDRKKYHKRNKQDKLQPVITAIDYGNRNIYFMNYENNELITVHPDDIQGWPGDAGLQHTAISANGKRAWITTDASATQPPQIVELRINNYNWAAGTANVKVKKVTVAGSVGEPSTFPDVHAVNELQGVPQWIQPLMTQIHAPTILPFSDFIYFTEYPTSKVHIYNKKKRKLVDTVSIEGWTNHTHGIVWNDSGTIGVGSGYFFDENMIDVYVPNRVTGEITPKGQIMLGTPELHAAMTHLLYPIDERYFITGTMQISKTSISTGEIIPPSVWVVDTHEMTATKILDRSLSPNDPGVFQSASDVAVVNNFLYVAEESSLGQDGNEFANDGYISVYDITDRLNPVFVKRLMPGIDLPNGWRISHTFSPTTDNRFVIVGSWLSGLIIKIDAFDHTVSHVWSAADGIQMGHGIYVSGGLR